MPEGKALGRLFDQQLGRDEDLELLHQIGLIQSGQFAQEGEIKPLAHHCGERQDPPRGRRERR